MLPFPAIRAQAQTAGVALVIGNSKYQWEAPLPNVRRDAPDIAKRFQALGLRTELVQEPAATRQALDKFATACRGANFAATYFAGHGATWQRAMYLVPLDADLSAPSAVERCIPSADINQATKDTAHRLPRIRRPRRRIPPPLRLERRQFGQPDPVQRATRRRRQSDDDTLHQTGRLARVSHGSNDTHPNVVASVGRRSKTGYRLMVKL